MVTQKNTKEQIKALKRQAIVKVKDEIIEKRDRLINQLEQQLAQRTETETHFTIRWSVRQTPSCPATGRDSRLHLAAILTCNQPDPCAYIRPL